MIENSSFSHQVFIKFIEWVETYDDHNRFDTLFEFAVQWMIDDKFDLIEDYTTFIEAFLIIIDVYENNPSLLDYKGELSFANRERDLERIEQDGPARRRRVKRVLDIHTDNLTMRKFLDRRLVSREIKRHQS